MSNEISAPDNPSYRVTVLSEPRPQKPTCKWTVCTCGCNRMNTGCGDWIFPAKGVDDFKYCPHCGKEIKKV